MIRRWLPLVVLALAAWLLRDTARGVWGFVGWSGLSVSEQLIALTGAWVGGFLVLLGVALFRWGPRRQPAAAKAEPKPKSKRKPANKRGRR